MKTVKYHAATLKPFKTAISSNAIIACFSSERPKYFPKRPKTVRPKKCSHMVLLICNTSQIFSSCNIKHFTQNNDFEYTFSNHN